MGTRQVAKVKWECHVGASVGRCTKEVVRQWSIFFFSCLPGGGKGFLLCP